MSSVLFCWELGGGLGHIAKAVLLAERLLDEGCEVTFAFKDLAEVHALLPMDDYRLVQSPVWSRNLVDRAEPGTYPELLLHFGFGSPVGMMGLCRAWRSLLSAFNVDLVIADHAPNAILAARTLDVPVASFGNGFFIPPHCSPMPPYRSTSVVASEMMAAEALALRSANECLASFGKSSLSHLHELFDIERHLLCTVPELDHYQDRPAGKRGETHYCGPVYVDQVGVAPVWPARDSASRKRVFAYLYAQMAGLDALVTALIASGADVLLYCAGLPPALAAACEGTSVRLLRGLVNLREMVASTDLFVCGGTDTAYCALFNGVPVLGVPISMEQQITCERMVALGGARWLPPGSNSAAWSTLLDLMLEDEKFLMAAKQFAEHHRAQTPAAAIELIASECLALM